MKSRFGHTALLAVCCTLVAADHPQAKWTVNLEKMKNIPNAPAGGSIMGTEFVVEEVEYNPVVGTIKLRQGKGFHPDAFVLIFLFTDKGESLAGKKFEVSSKKPPDGKVPHVHIGAMRDGDKVPKVAPFASRYAMRLEFGEESEGEIPAKIYACFPDETKSYIAGTFTLEVK